MKTFKQISEAVEDGPATFDTEHAKDIVDTLKSKYNLEIGVSKSTLGGEHRASFFFKIHGPKSTWKHGIALNSPVSFGLVVNREGTVESTGVFNHELRNAGVKPFRKAKFKNPAEAKKKILAYVQKNWKLMEPLTKDTNESIEEAKAAGGYEIKHKTYSSAVQHAASVAKKRGYEIDDEDWDNKIATGPKKPSSGKTNRFIIKLKKNGKESPRTLHIQVYNADNAFYELNMYID